MSNTDRSGLNHTKVTLSVDCGEFRSKKVEMPSDYPTEFFSVSSDEQRVGFPTPNKIIFEDDNSLMTFNLFTDEEMNFQLSILSKNISTILQASIVNEKQRKALEEIIASYFGDLTNRLYH